jgi:hypothetical protein
LRAGRRVAGPGATHCRLEADPRASLVSLAFADRALCDSDAFEVRPLVTARRGNAVPMRRRHSGRPRDAAGAHPDAYGRRRPHTRKQQRASSPASRRATAHIRPTQQRASAPSGSPGLLLCREARVSPCAPGRRPWRKPARRRRRRLHLSESGSWRCPVRRSPPGAERLENGHVLGPHGHRISPGRLGVQAAFG